jgi:hypothetical protein
MQFDQLRRRAFITLLGGAPRGLATDWLSRRPSDRLLAFSAQVRRQRGHGTTAALGMRELGYVEGRDYGFEDRYCFPPAVVGGRVGHRLAGGTG